METQVVKDNLAAALCKLAEWDEMILIPSGYKSVLRDIADTIHTLPVDHSLFRKMARVDINPEWHDQFSTFLNGWPLNSSSDERNSTAFITELNLLVDEFLNGAR